jgi:hypothetical protein
LQEAYQIRKREVFLKGGKAKKKNYENSNISPFKNIIFKKKSSKRNQNPLRYYYKLISSFNISQIIIFKKSSNKNRPIIIT